MLTPKDDRKETFTFRKFHLSKNNSEQHNSLMPCCKWLFFHVLPPWLVLGSERTGLPFPPPVPQAAICPPGNRDHLDHHHPCHHHHYHRHHHHNHHHHLHHAPGTNPSPETVIIWIICRTKYIFKYITLLKCKYICISKVWYICILDLGEIRQLK